MFAPVQNALLTRLHPIRRYKVPSFVSATFRHPPRRSQPSPAIDMSPIALPTQRAAVLHGAKDLRLEDRTLWPPHQGQAQVAVMSTGLCGSDCKYFVYLYPLLLLQPSFLSPIQCTTTLTDATATSSYKPPSSSVTKLLAS